MPRRISMTAAVAAVALFIAGCTTSGDATATSMPAAPPSSAASSTTRPLATTTPPDDPAGFGSPAQAPGEFDGLGNSSAIRAELRLAGNGCWHAHISGVSHMVVFPVGYTIPFSDDPRVIDSPDGVRYLSGDRVDGTARVLFTDELPGGAAGKWADHKAFCDPAGAQIVVFDDLWSAFDPDAFDEDELAALVAGATFTEHWSCGRGWAISTSDERVAIYIYQQGEEPLAAGTTIDLPHPDWRARLVIGEFLFVNHCDDVFESWEPSAVVAADWVLDSGVIEVLDDFPEGMEPASVNARLDGAAVVTDSGRRIPLPTIELHNRGFNFFAG